MLGARLFLRITIMTTTLLLQRHAALAWMRPMTTTTTLRTTPRKSNIRNLQTTLFPRFHLQKQHVVSTRRRSLHQSVDDYDDYETAESGYRRPVVQWYPGHIAKAERQLQETFKAVDVVVEVRDARAPKATCHPAVGTWCAGKPRIVVLTHEDAISNAARNAWKRAYEELGAEHWEEAVAQVDLQIQNQANQALQERIKYTTTTTTSASSKKQKQSNNSAAIVSPVHQVLFVNAKQGAGIHALTRSVLKAGAFVQTRRANRGLKERPLRVGVIGYPNVGKSALINKLLNRKRAKTANIPGVTRSLQWIRVKSASSTNTGDSGKSSTGKGEFELLDSPGIIPATLEDQTDALLLAACNCIGQAAYDNQSVAAFLCQWLLTLYRLGYGPQFAPDWPAKCKLRYGIDPLTDFTEPDMNAGGMLVRERTGEDLVFAVADATCQGNPEDAARKILQDFRTGRMGLVCLQVAPVTIEDQGQVTVVPSAQEQARRRTLAAQQQVTENLQARAAAARATAQERGLELPPMLLQDETLSSSSSSSSDTTTTTTTAESEKDTLKDVGKGLFDGW